MEKEKSTEISRIAYLIKEIEKIKKFKENLRFNMQNDENRVIKTKYLFEHKIPGGFGSGEIEIDNNTMSRFCTFLDQEEQHLKKLLEESDQELVVIAQAYLSGKLGALIERSK